LHDTWLQLARVGAIIGPHGCGKSTLLATLAEHWPREFGYRVTQVALHDGERTLPESFWHGDYQERDLLIIDGYEQLGWRARWALQRLRRRTSCGLLVTGHTATRLPTLHRVEPDYPTFLAVVRQLLEPWNDSRLAEEFLERHAATAWQQTGGNAREALFRLYDCWEEDCAKLIPLAPGQ
jgi:energy-coupling factor transporter ATP-binding protein EcfA2